MSCLGDKSGTKTVDFYPWNAPNDISTKYEDRQLRVVVTDALGNRAEAVVQVTVHRCWVGNEYDMSTPN